jgi:hypothetical protein
MSFRSGIVPEHWGAFDERVIEDVRAYAWHFIPVADEHHPEYAESNAALGPHPIHDATFG